MNIRLIALIVVLIGFSFGCGVLSFLYGGGINLEQAYNNNQISLVQKTYAGSIPHNVIVKNNGSQPVVVEKGTILTSDESQDLVIIENKKISPNSNDSVQAYCLEPNQKAIPHKKLKPSGIVSPEINHIIDNSEPSNLQNATKSQLQIWILVGKGNVNPYTGEARALVENQGIRYYQLRQNLSNAKNSVMEQFNMTDTTIENISITSDSNTANQWFSDLRQWLRFNLGI
jgi:hypothetical protein